MISSEFNFHGNIIAFDLDDTLYRERDFVFSGINALVDAFIPPAHRMEAAKKLREVFEGGGNFMDALAEGYPEAAAGFGSRDERIKEFLGIYRNHCPSINLRRGMHDLLVTLRTPTTRFVLITDGRSASQRNKIKALGIEEFFAPENILISEETGSEKITGEPFRKIMHRYPEARGFFYLGDNVAKDFEEPMFMGWSVICMLDSEGVNIHPQNPEELKRLSTMGCFFRTASSPAEAENIIRETSSRFQ